MHLNQVYCKLDIPGTEEGFLPHLRLAYYWNCELFQVGLKELGLVA